MRNTFSGQGWLITGGASGIGLATARRLKEQGARLMLWDVNEAALQRAEEELGATTQRVDVTQPNEVEGGMARAIEILGCLQGVLHSAGILRTGLFTEISPEEHCRLVEVNLGGTVLTAYYALPYLKITRGSLVLMGSGSAYYGTPEFNTYGAAKAGVLNLAQALRIEVQNSGVHVAVVNPLFVESPMLDERNRRARYVRRFGMTHTPEQVARSIVRGIERRQFLIFPSLRPRINYLLTRQLHWLAHPIMRFFWR